MSGVFGYCVIMPGNALLRLHESAPFSRVVPWRRRGLCLVLSSPSGGGKTTITRRLLRYDSSLRLSVSATTRPRRGDEEEGRDYYFLSLAEFEERRASGWFVETAEVFGNFYGTPRAPVEAALREGASMVFDIDWQGAEQLVRELGGDVVTVFLLPPDLGALRERLKLRAQDGADVMEARLGGALREVGHWVDYDYVLVNHDLDEATAYVQSIFLAERLRRERQSGAADVIDEKLHP
ncbi:MAG: guanylate kinase [Alphaproteobacteria bacterium]|nr:guanylate kinase [Alphaproteobacteria bacterium]